MATENRDDRPNNHREPLSPENDWEKASPIAPDDWQRVPRFEEISARTSSLNKLLRGELAAFETYRHAIYSFSSDPRKEDMNRIAEDHRQAVMTLGRDISERGGEPASTSGPWGAWA